MPFEDEDIEKEQERPYVAIASLEGLFVNQHLGQAERLRIYKPGPGRPELVGLRATPPPEKGIGRWKELSKVLKDCGWLLVGGIGEAPHVILANQNVKIHVIEGLIEDALKLIATGGDLKTMAKPEATPCIKPCHSQGMCGGD